MKKYIFLFTFTIILASFFILSEKYFNSLIIETDVVVVDQVSVDEDMICTGKVEFEKSKNIFASSSCAIKEIFFKEGDCVKKEDVLLEVFEVEEKVTPTASSPNKNLPDIPNSYDFNSIYKKFLESHKDSEKNGNNLNPSGVRITSKITKITSPVSGVLTSLNVKEGQYISACGAIATVSDRSSLQVRMKISETQVSNIAVGQKVTITGVGFKNATYEGSVKSIAGQAFGNQENMNSDVFVDVVVSVNASDENIKPGFTVKCKIIFNKDCDVTIVPYKSVKADENGKEYVYKCENDKTIKTYITTGREFDDGFEVKTGICEGEIIISDPNSVTENATVKAKNITN